MYATASGRWAYRVVLVIFALSIAVCIEPAMFGKQQWNPGAFGGFIGAAIAARMRDGSFRRLTPRGRRQVELAVLSGVPTGSAPLDHVARDRLIQAVRGRSRGNTVAFTVVVVLVLVASVAASVRMDQALYLLTLVPAAALIAAACFTRTNREHPSRRLARFDQATAAGEATV